MGVWSAQWYSPQAQKGPTPIWCSAITVLKFMFFEQKGPNFHLVLGLQIMKLFQYKVLLFQLYRTEYCDSESLSALTVDFRKRKIWNQPGVSEVKVHGSLLSPKQYWKAERRIVQVNLLQFIEGGTHILHHFYEENNSCYSLLATPGHKQTLTQPLGAC